MTFSTVIKGHGTLNATGILVPEAVAEALGNKRAKVVATLGQSQVGDADGPQRISAYAQPNRRNSPDGSSAGF